jgi:hypothetical protein
MTDLEMAEAQIKKWDSLLYPQMYPVALVKDFIRKAYLEGLKAGRPKWHKVAERLPENCTCVLCALKDGGLETAFYEDGDFCFCAPAYHLQDVAAWAYIPEYKESE